MSSACTLGGAGVVEVGMTAMVEGRTELVTQAKRERVHAIVACERIDITIRQTNTATVPFGTQQQVAHSCRKRQTDFREVLFDGEVHLLP